MKATILKPRPLCLASSLTVLLAGGWFGLATLMAAPADVSGMAELHKLTLSAGPNFIAAPMHPAPTFQGAVVAVAAETMTFIVNPAWAANRFAPADGNAQYLAVLSRDQSASPSHEGEWWPVTSNTANALSLDTGGEDLIDLVETGDHHPRAR